MEEKSFLLDTNALYWYVHEPERLSVAAAECFADAQNEFYVSYASLWEMAIKNLQGRLPLRPSFERFIKTLYVYEVYVLELSLDDLVAYQSLPIFTDHRDPFDRLILAQALRNRLPIISADSQFERYSVKVIW